ncbi:hypothetical protein GCM10009827_120290 [Dactylosporangium maewongense]|uniref:Uncharacterized protein n=1 Tax=Dactylosporangium maewongense TaxID=634393 RepID=A0ABN2DMI2_9ACTN
MLDQSSRHIEYTAGSMHIRGRTILLACIDEYGPFALGVLVDEELLSSGLSRVVAGLSPLASDHAEVFELRSAYPREDGQHVVETFPAHTPGKSSALVALRPSPAVPSELQLAPPDHAADGLPPLLPQPGLRYRDGSVAHHRGEYVAPGRRVVTGTWRYPSPKVCRDDRTTGAWIGPPDQPAEQVLVCVSCGLDCT